jgi:hypothetical protein
MHWLEAEWKDKMDQPLNSDDWTVDSFVQDSPSMGTASNSAVRHLPALIGVIESTNLVLCALVQISMCHIANHLASRVKPGEFRFAERQVPMVQSRMAYEILEGKVADVPGFLV